ncbi:MAG: SIMPL domain-containing protein [Leeuwenhoekiella sp.]
MKTILLNLCLFITATTMAQFSSNSLITVSGQGEITVVPDQVTISLGVETSGEKAEMVKTANDNAIDNIIKYALKNGIKQNNIKTQYVNLNKNFNYQDKTTSYSASQTLKLKMEDLNDYEDLIAGLLSQGVNSINGIEFSSSKMKEYEQKARSMAMQNAKEKADQYAGSAGKTVGQVMMITEAGTTSPQPRPMMKSMAMMDAPSSRETLAAGEMTITDKVEVSYYMLDKMK